MTRTAHKKIIRKRKLSPVLLGVCVLALLLGIILIGKFAGAIGSLSKPYSLDASVSTKNFSWDGESVINIAVKADKIYTLSYNPKSKSVVIFKIPDETYINVPFGFGRWVIKSVYGLGQSESPQIGANLFKDTISSSFGLPIDGYLILPEDLNMKPFEKIVSDIRQNPLSAFSLFRGSKTDLSILEFINLVWDIRGVRFDKISPVDLERSTLTSWQLLADGSRVLNLDEERLDQYIQKYFGDEKLRDESLSVGIYNATDHPALAGVAGRLIENISGRVVFTANSPIHLDKSVVTGKDSYTKHRLTEIFAPSCASKSTCDTSRAVGSSQADINIFLGEDYFLRYNSR